MFDYMRTVVLPFVFKVHRRRSTTLTVTTDVRRRPMSKVNIEQTQPCTSAGIGALASVWKTTQWLSRYFVTVVIASAVHVSLVGIADLLIWKSVVVDVNEFLQGALK